MSTFCNRRMAFRLSPPKLRPSSKNRLLDQRQTPSLTCRPPDMLLQAILGAQKGKAVGPDGIPSEVGHASPLLLRDLLLPLVCKVGMTGTEPVGFKSGVLAKLYKGKGPRQYAGASGDHAPPHACENCAQSFPTESLRGLSPMHSLPSSEGASEPQLFWDLTLQGIWPVVPGRRALCRVALCGRGVDILLRGTWTHSPKA